MTDQNSRSVIHAYGVLAPGTDVPDSVGIGHAPVLPVDIGSLRVVISRLDAEDYGEAVWQQHQEDPRWIAAVAQEHQQVLGELVTTADVIPFRLPSLYADDDDLRHAIERESELLCAALAAVAGHVEWGAKLFLLAREAGAGEDEERPRSGREYLRQRSLRADRRADHREQVAAEALTVFGALADSSSHSLRNAVLDKAVTGRPHPMVLNSAHLVPRRCTEQFLATSARLRESLAPAGLELEVSGPWPPYNFAHLDVAELRDSS